MKKLLFVLTLSLSMVAKAQWNTSGSNIYNSTAGYVGIGTTTPLTLFDVRLAGNQHVQFVQNLNGIDSGYAGIISSNDSNIGYPPLGFWASNYYLGGGNVGIATQEPGSYRLAVNNSIYAKQVNVDLNGWADEVFKKAYRLPSLKQLKQFIIQNGHLPDVPSENVLNQNCLDVSAIMKVQMNQIEELTFYLIETDKEIMRLRGRISKVERKNGQI